MGPPNHPPNTNDKRIGIFQKLVLVTEKGNTAKKWVNAWRQQCRLDSMAPGDVSDDEPEDLMPELADFVDLGVDSYGSNLEPSTSGPRPVAPESTLDPLHPEPADTSALELAPNHSGPSNPSLENIQPCIDLTTNASEWLNMFASLQSSHHPTQMAAPLKPQINWVALSPTFTSAEATSNSH